MKTRKSNRSKRISHSCSNNGSCAYCTNDRTYSNRKREPVVDVSIMSTALGELTQADARFLSVFLHGEYRTKRGR